MAFSTRSFVTLSAPLTGVPILAIGAPLAEPPSLNEPRAICEPPAAAPFLLERRARVLSTRALSSVACVQRALDVGLPRKPPPMADRREQEWALFEPCAAPRRALTPRRRRVVATPSPGPVSAP